jgi:hypothetical protein
MICCVGVTSLARIAGQIHGLPSWWELIDMSSGIVDALRRAGSGRGGGHVRGIVALVIRRDIRRPRMETESEESPSPAGATVTSAA